MTLDLRGRLEAVQLFADESCPSTVFGELPDTLVSIRNSGRYLGKTCLIRIDGHYEEGGRPYGNFITSQVPPGFRGLACGDYILCAEWQPEMQKKGEFPTFTELLYYYQPRNLSYFFYFGQRWGRRNKVVVTKKEVRPSGKSFSKAVRNLQKMEKTFARLIVVESSEQMEELEDIVRVHGLTPIVMEPLE